MTATTALARTPPRMAARRVLLIVAAITVGFAALLRLLDTVPSVLRDEPRSVREYPTLETLERDTRTQLVLPFYFPDTLAWPPVEIARAAGDGRPTRVTIADRATGAARLIVGQCLDGECDLSRRLLPAGQVVSREPVTLGGGRGELVRQRIDGLGDVTDVTWIQFDRRIVLRFQGDDGELMRIARSMRRGLP